MLDDETYPETGVLVNKLGIKNQNLLYVAEQKLTMLRLLELVQHPMKGNFDLKHLQAIHHHIFQDLYSWAGQLRKVDIGKGNMFCHVPYIQSESNKLFLKLKKENFLAELPTEQFAERMAWYFSEINAIHPFREGNGRTEREFIRSLALKNNYQVEFAQIRNGEILEASRESFICNYKPMENIFKKILTKISN